MNGAQREFSGACYILVWIKNIVSGFFAIILKSGAIVCLLLLISFYNIEFSLCSVKCLYGSEDCSILGILCV